MCLTTGWGLNIYLDDVEFKFSIFIPLTRGWLVITVINIIIIINILKKKKSKQCRWITEFTFFILDGSGTDEKQVFYNYSLIFNYWSYFWLNHMLYMLNRGLISLHWKYFISMLFIISLLKTILCHSVDVYISNPKSSIRTVIQNK